VKVDLRYIHFELTELQTYNGIFLSLNMQNINDSSFWYIFVIKNEKYK
jgi:hypothetical protein